VIIKGLQLLLIASIFNPFCCCLAGVVTIASADAGPMTHACCSSANSERPSPADNSTPPADHEDCPHQSYKSHQQVTQKDIKAEQLTSGYAPVLVAVIEQFGANSDFVVETFAASHPPTAVRRASPPGLTTLYCVYRI